MAERLGRVAGGRWPVQPKAASCFVRRGFPHSVRRSDDLDSPGDGQMKSRTHRVTLADLTKAATLTQKKTCSGPPSSSQ